MKSKYPTLHVDPPSVGTEVFLHLGDTSPEAYLQSRIDLDPQGRSGVRVLKNSPESMSVQIWTHGKTSFSRTGKPRTVYSLFSSNRQNMLKLAKEIERIAKLLPEV